VTNPSDPTGPLIPNFPGSLATQEIANWKCYEILDQEPVQLPSRFLEDQFTEAVEAIPGVNKNVIIGDAIKLCTPADKTHGIFVDLPPCEELGDPDPTTGIIPCEIESTNVDVHLKCYELAFQDVAPDLTLDLFDQFTDEDNDILSLDKICVDAEKELVIAGTFIPLDSVMILLAGAQISAVWILPALVAVTGIGYGIDIARKYRKDSK